MLEIYDQHIWGDGEDESVRELINSISLLLRLELRGIDVGSRWQEIAAGLYPRLHEHAIAFLDLHYIYALVKGGQLEWANQMLESMEDYAQKALPYAQRTWQEVTLSAARGMIAHAQANWQNAIAYLEPILPEIYTVGGSHAQRDLFEQVYLDALIKVGEYRQAANLLEKRSATRSNIPVIQRQLEHVNSQLAQVPI